MRPLYIFDLDGTLADIQHRRHFVERPKEEQNWDAFYRACVDDAPIDRVIAIANHLGGTFSEIWIFTGRSDMVRNQTVDWLNQKTTFFIRGLRMRKHGDYTPDDQLKEQWLNEMSPEDRARLVCVFEDRKRVVDMWRRNGVTCLQVAEGNF